MSDQGQPAGDGQQGDGGEAQATQAPDFSAIAQTLEAQGQSLEEVRSLLQNQPQPQQPQEQAPAEPDYLQQLFGDLDQQEPEPQQLNPDALQQFVQSEIQKAVAPVQQEHQEYIIQQEAERLTQEYPELREQDRANLLLSHARQMAEQIGSPDLANKPAFWRMAYDQLLQREAAAEEKAAASEPPAAHLEGASGAGPAGQAQVDLVKMIGESGGAGGSVLPFG
jgi:hypothetical protein